MTPIEEYIRQAARLRKLNEDDVMRLVMSEGGAKSLEDPVYQSQIGAGGPNQEPSYGPFQMFTGGGLGNAAAKAGINVRDPNQWKQTVDFALDHILRSGIGAWNGPKNIGLKAIRGQQGGIPTSADVSKGVTLNTTPDQTTISADSSPAAAPASPVAETGEASSEASSEESDPLTTLAKAFKQETPEPDPIASSGFGADSGEAARMASAQALFSQILNKRRAQRGISLTG